MKRIKSRTRQLANGKWVVEVKVGLLGGWKFVDLKAPRYCWRPGDNFFNDCLADTEEQAAAAGKEHMARCYAI